ncbi:serine endopeptidase [Pseudorhodoferax sp.]|uniref:serine endopeptidase n=1 Tax=Pseudorhodoferax sp. TaxID=1993553 RepID=UPI0039E27B79
MRTSLRLSERWYSRALWLVALVFAGFLIGLGGALVGDLPRVEHQHRVEDFMDASAAGPVQAAQAQAEAAQRQAGSELERAELKLQAAAQAYVNGRQTFENWIATRGATQLSGQDAALVQRTRALDALKAAEEAEQRQVDALRERAAGARQAAERADAQWRVLERQARERWAAEQRRAELRVFLYRLALTLPLLAVAGWLFAKKRRSTWWPFVWGFILFALFTFFVELVPYLPSYGGYVRYTVGIVVTVLVGRQAILALQRYLARQQQAEAQPDAERRRTLDYDLALARLAKKVCPGCERQVDLQDGVTDFCPHCGIGLFDRCGGCQLRKSAFARYCPGCGAAARASAG